MQLTETALQPRWLVRLSVAMFAAGVAVTALVIVRPSFTPNVSDFGRDLIGAEAVNKGMSPYQTLGQIADAVPGLEVPDDARNYWVAHTPISVAGARLLLAVGHGAAEGMFYWVVVASTIAVLAYAWWAGGRGYTGLALVGAIGLAPGIAHDLIWLQGASLVALTLGAVYHLAHRGHRMIAAILMGLLVAWKPWTAPLALFIPKSITPYRDALKVGVIAAAATAISVPVVGGVSAMQDWLTEALPANTAAYLTGNWNLSITSRWLGAIGCVIVVAVLCLGLLRTRLEPGQKRIGAALAILSFSPLVWPWYWIALLPALLSARSRRFNLHTTVALFLMAFPITRWGEDAVRFASMGAALVLAVGLYLEVRNKQIGRDLHALQA